MKYVCFFMLCLMVTCVPSNQDQFSEKEISYIKNFCTNKLMESVVEKKDSIVKNYSLELLGLQQSEDMLVYILNGECSVCISQFLRFLDIIEVANVRKNITVIVSAKYIESVKFFVQKTDLKLSNQLFYQILSSGNELNIDFYNGLVLYIHNKELINIFSFIDFENDFNYMKENEY